MKRCLLGAALFCLVLSAQAELPNPVAFGVALEVGDLARARQWLDEGLDPNFPADRIGTGLMIGAWEGNIPLMELFFQRGADLNAVNGVGEQALQLAAWKGQRQAVEWLLARGAAVNRQGLAWGALHYAVFAGHREIARLLMERGADVNGRAPNGSTVLMMAAREGHEDLARALIEAGADPSPVNEWGDNALGWAMRHNNLRIARMIASPEEFALAVKRPPESFGVARRSVPPPAQIGEILRQIRLAQAQGQPVEALRQTLFDAVADFKKDVPVTALVARGKKPTKAPSEAAALVITADRKQAGAERAELIYAPPPAPAPSLAPATASDAPAELLRQLRLADAAGKPTAELRRRFLEAVARFKAP